MSDTDLPDLFGDRFTLESYISTPGCSQETIASGFIQCVRTGTPMIDELRSIGFHAVVDSADGLIKWYRDYIDSLPVEWSQLSECVAAGDLFDAADVIANMLHVGTGLIALSTIQPDMFGELLFDFETAIAPYSERIGEWHSAPAVMSVKQEIDPTLAANRWWLAH